MPLTCGVRPNSPAQTTIVSSSSPRDCQVADQGRERLVQRGQEAVAEECRSCRRGCPSRRSPASRTGRRPRSAAGPPDAPGPAASGRSRRGSAAGSRDRSSAARTRSDRRISAAWRWKRSRPADHLGGLERPQAAVEPVAQAPRGTQVARRESVGERHPARLERAPRAGRPRPRTGRTPGRGSRGRCPGHRRSARRR